MVPRPEGMPEDAYDFLSVVPHYESGWRNIRNYAYNDDPRKGPIKTASGLWQITNTNWNNYAPGLDIRDARDPSKPARTAMDALPEDQLKVAYALWKDQGEQPWTGFNRDLAIARQTGVRARPASPQELALYGFRGGAGGGGMSATARKGLGLDGAGAGGVEPASYTSGMWPPVPGAGGGEPTDLPPIPSTTPPPTEAPPWLSNIVGPNAAAAIGSAPRGEVGTGGTGFLGQLTSLLTNPLTQGLAKGYFAAVGGPRGVSPFARLGAGLAGLTEGVTGAERQQQLEDPLARQQLQEGAQKLQMNQYALADLQKMRQMYGYTNPEMMKLAVASQSVAGNLRYFQSLIDDPNTTPDIKQRATAMKQLQLGNPYTPIAASEAYGGILGKPEDPEMKQARITSMATLDAIRLQAQESKNRELFLQHEGAVEKETEALGKEADAAWANRGAWQKLGSQLPWGNDYETFKYNYMHDPNNLKNHPILSNAPGWWSGAGGGPAGPGPAGGPAPSTGGPTPGAAPTPPSPAAAETPTPSAAPTPGAAATPGAAGGMQILRGPDGRNYSVPAGASLQMNSRGDARWIMPDGSTGPTSPVETAGAGAASPPTGG